MSERTIGERNSTLVFGELGVPALGDDAFSVEILHQLRETLQFQISQDIANGLGLRLVDDQLPILRIVTERHRATGPFALAPAGSDLVADALGGQFALEPRKGQQHIQRQPAHGGRGVELVGHRYK
jgi:hypothetical protein